MSTSIRVRCSSLAALAAVLALSACASVMERAYPKHSLMEFGSLPSGTPFGYVEFVHAPTSAMAQTMAAWTGPSSQPVRPEGSHGLFKNVRDPDSGRVTPWRVRLVAPVGPQRFELMIVGVKTRVHEVTVPVEADRVTPVEVEWKVLSSFLGSRRYAHSFRVGQPLPYTPAGEGGNALAEPSGAGATAARRATAHRTSHVS